MKASELRMWNWVLNDGEVFQISHGYEIDDAIHQYEPIPLTDEWLLKAGFEKKDENHLIFSDGFIGFRYFPLVRGIELEIEGQIIPLYLHQYVHQLQNLYFALTGEELEFNHHENTN